MKIKFHGRLPKHLEFPDAIEDFYGLSSSNRRIAVSDGASISYDSKSWAEILPRGFIEGENFSPSYISKAIVDYEGAHPLHSLSWSKQAAFQIGSFATFLGIAWNEQQKILTATALGDSEIFLLNDLGEVIDTFPYTSSEDFQKNPTLICTNPTNNTAFTEEYIQSHTATWDTQQLGYVLLMTDALADWCFRMAKIGKDPYQLLININTLEELAHLVEVERREKRMKIDDVTLITLVFHGDSTLSFEDPGKRKKWRKIKKIKRHYSQTQKDNNF